MKNLNRRVVARSRRAAAWAAVSDLGLAFTAADAARLQAAIQGTVILPSDPEYPSARQGFVPNFQDFPQIIVACTVIADVQAALAFARRHELWVVCRSGGHSTAGYSVNSGMVLDLAGLNDVVVDPDRQRAVVGAGCRFGKLNAALDTYGLHVPGGSCADVAVGGYAQGGGYGLTSLMFGMHCDSIESALVVLADGRLVRADDDHHANLFWALRGGTGNTFGVVVQFTYRLRPLGDLWGFGIGFDLEHAPEALAVMQRDFTGAATPAGLGHESLLVYEGSKRRYVVRGVVDGTEEKGRQLLGSLLAVPGASLDISQRASYTRLNERLLALPDVPEIARSISDSRYVAQPLDAQAWAVVVEHFGRSANNGNFVAIEPAGAAINEVAPLATAYIHRRATMDVFSWVFWMDEGERGPAEQWLDELIAILEPLSNHEAYQNYPRRSNARFADMYWGEAYPRLQQVKAAYDPDNFFHFEQSVRI